MKAPTAALLALALVFTVLVPLHSDLAAWTWSWWLLASLSCWGWARQPATDSFPVAGSSATRAGPLGWPLIGPAAVALLVACLIGLAMGTWHEEGWRGMRQDGKVLMVLPMVGVLSRLLLDSRIPGSSVPAWREQLGWALGLQLAVAAAVALLWPRAQLPATAIPWATAVALTMAVLGPLVLIRDGVHPDSRAWRIGLTLALLAGATAVVWSRSRAAWVVLPWLMLVAVALAQRPARAVLWSLVVAVLAGGTGVLYDSLQPPQVERGLRLLDLLQELGQLGTPDGASSLGSRVVLWQTAWDSLWQHPLTGIGVSQRIALVQAVIPPEALPDVAPLVHVHQQFLNQAVDHGLPGLLAAVLSAAAPWALAWRAGPGLMRWQCMGIGTVHGTGLLFNANMTHGTYAFNLGLCLMAVLLIRAESEQQARGAGTPAGLR